MTAKTWIIIATLAIAALIVGVGHYNADYPETRHAALSAPSASGDALQHDRITPADHG